MTTTTTTIGGYIDTDGSILSGSDFTVIRQSRGKYLVTFHTAFSAKPAIVVTQVYPKSFSSNGSTKDNAVITDIDKDKFQYITGKSDGYLDDRAASFIAIG